MKVLAIDPGYGRCGMAIVEREASGKDILIHSDCIETSSTMEFTERLNVVASACASLISQHAPDSVAMEKLYFSNNQKTAMRVAEVRGAILAVAGAAGIAVTEYTPGEIKSATTGYGSADKKAVAQMVRMLVKIDKVIRLDDEYDAIAIGITHLASARTHAARVLRAER
ncbi:MAG: ruvC [Candidatus Kaiserbacteria bacterium]|nr:ruvC [Candidatus Kaiserbacteria bacterium]